MRITKQMLGIIALMFFFTSTAHAFSMPKRGEQMAQVESQFGPPVNQYDAVGNPPITRWDYEEFSVYFEHRTVVHSVDHSKALIPMRLHENRPQTSAPTAAPETEPVAPATPQVNSNKSNGKYRYDTTTGRMVPRE